MRATIKHTSQAEEFYTQERCFIIEISNSEDDPDVSIARARVSPGVTTCRHRLKSTAERYYILSGKGQVQIGDNLTHEITAGDIVLIPPMSLQRITNTGISDLIFLAICTPRFSDDVYEDLEKGGPE